MSSAAKTKKASNVIIIILNNHFTSTINFIVLNIYNKREKHTLSSFCEKNHLQSQLSIYKVYCSIIYLSKANWHQWVGGSSVCEFVWECVTASRCHHERAAERTFGNRYKGNRAIKVNFISSVQIVQLFKPSISQTHLNWHF